MINDVVPRRQTTTFHPDRSSYWRDRYAPRRLAIELADRFVAYDQLADGLQRAAEQLYPYGPFVDSTVVSEIHLRKSGGAPIPTDFVGLCRYVATTLRLADFQLVGPRGTAPEAFAYRPRYDLQVDLTRADPVAAGRAAIEHLWAVRRWADTLGFTIAVDVFMGDAVAPFLFAPIGIGMLWDASSAVRRDDGTLAGEIHNEEPRPKGRGI